MVQSNKNKNMNKKIVLVFALAMLVVGPASASAITPGRTGLVGGNINSDQGANCLVWREGMPTDVAAFNGQGFCSNNNPKRIYELEVVVQQLERQNADILARLSQLSGSANNAPVNVDAGLFQRVLNLEGKVEAIEKAMNTLQTAVLGTLGQVISLLQRLALK